MKIKNRVVIVTGGTKQIGLSICGTLLENNIDVAFIGTSKSSIADALKALEVNRRKNTICKGFKYDLLKLEGINKLINDIMVEFGQIDILINSAGLLDLSSIENSSIDRWNEVMTLNLSAPFFLVKNVLPHLKKSNAPRIVNIASNAGRMGGYANGMSYTSSKGGLIALTYGLARQLANWNITVNCVAPGTIESEMLNSRDPETIKELLEKFPIKRFGKCNEVAQAVRYFIDEDSGFTTGAVLDVNGGLFTG